ncbi:uncharacterized protein C2orf74 homolog [Macrotis lagotis]|uniref:uncharacterized protein C2orf74 homolog n=1 Tax=Macrotis lagotis TaxID=92651 RepID=UPI003D694584
MGRRAFVGNMKLNPKKLHAETKKKMTDPTKDRATSMKPGILVQRQDRKQMLVLPWKNEEIREEKRKMMEFDMPKWFDSDTEKEDSEMSEGEYLISNSSSAEDSKLIKEVTFSQEVVVVDLGKGNDKPQYYTREHKDQK